ncbi:thioredoxin domain-containing protein [Flindersiella endophytica]
MNRLGAETSPYLLQHADNPVHWWPWSDEAFAEARRRDVPILLSVGYSACHWCHVMAHESFEDERTAAYMNEHFVNIKVDREERPDVDAVYMTATQAMTGQGGWPMTCFLTPDGEPFYCGTYFPPEPRHGMPAFGDVLAAIVRTWDERRADVLEAGAKVVESLAQQAFPAGSTPTADALDAAVRTLGQQFDSAHGGFGGAPKFPPSMVLEFLLRSHVRTGDAATLRMVEKTCDAMARGGMYDQIGGGFARYSVDHQWVVPHFEKMLYDNALLLPVYLHWWRLTGSPLAERIVRETAEFLLRELLTPEGGFAAALDADSEGVEGKFYVWTPDQLREVLGDEDAATAAKLFDVTAEGTFEHGSSTLRLLEDPTDEGALASIRERLLRARGERVRPGRDDKVVAAWNGLTIAALAEAGGLLSEPRYVDAARTAAELLVGVHTTNDGRLLRTSLGGQAGRSAGVLEDYACVATGYLALLAATGDAIWLRRAEPLLDTILTRFAGADGQFFDTSDDAEDLIQRPQDPTDNATPSGQFAAAGALLTYAAYTGSGRHRAAAEQAVGIAGLLAERAPRACGYGLAVAEALLAGPLEIAIVGDAGDPRRAELFRAALRTLSPGAVVVAGDVGTPDVPLLADRPLVDGGAAAYVCRGFVCDRPVGTVSELAARIDMPRSVST